MVFLPGPAMRHFRLALFLFLFLAAPAPSGAAAALHAQPAAILPACRPGSAAPAPGAPPAWLLLAGALVLLGAGRLAAS